MDDSYSQNHLKSYLSFAADHRELDDIPFYPSPIYGLNADHIAALADAKNFLYLINPAGYSAKSDFLAALAATNYDILLIDLFFNETALTASDITPLKTKHDGGTRLVMAYMSIGEAEDYRYYWKPAWILTPPSWLGAENPDWPGNYKVRYWEKGWRDIIYGGDSSYVRKILDAGFDGVYLDIIDAFEYFESM
jgi:cysteinyl-tRNA synthetase